MPKSSFSYFIKIFGCQMNYADAERITATLIQAGGESVKSLKKARMVVVLSCGVRQGAEERIISWIKRAKKENQKADIILTGCLSHREDIKKRLKNFIGSFVPINHWLTCVETHCNASLQRSNCDFYKIPPQYSVNHRAYVPIMTGCNNFCAYCVVPFARGREKSRSPEDILEEVEKRLEHGAKEIYLLGQNVASYAGSDKAGRIWPFAKLLRKIDSLPGNFWIRFISSHPKDLNDEFIRAFARGKKISPNLHLPVQSGSNRVLERMNRKYRRQEYLAKIRKVCQARPGTVFSSDIIVGFPGEKEKDFRDSLDIVKQAGFEMLYTLKYSPRPETAAFKLPDDVPAKTKKARQQKLDRVWKKTALEKNQRFLGKQTVILIDKIKARENQTGRTSYFVLGKNFENKDVSAPAAQNKNLLGKWAVVKINRVGALGLAGELVRILE